MPVLEEKLKNLFIGKGIKLHGLTSRLKTIQSLKQKLARPDKIYHELSEVTDLLGLRVVTYFEDSIEPIAKLIEQSFRVDFVHSTNKMHAIDHERFGYRSLHYVCYLPLPSERLKKIRFEIQIRTVLQDAWAEVEHDLGYKASDIAPSHLRRRFSRIASLLEIADEEFVSIKNDLKHYIEQTRNGIELKTADRAHLDLVALERLVGLEAVQSLDQAVAHALQKEKVSETIFYPHYLLRLLSLSGLKTIDEVIQKLKQQHEKALDLVLPYFQFSKEAWELGTESIVEVPKGYGLFFLSYSILLQSEELALNQITKFTEVFHQLDYPEDLKKAQQVATLFVKVFSRIP